MTTYWVVPDDKSIPGLTSGRAIGRLIVGLVLVAASTAHAAPGEASCTITTLPSVAAFSLPAYDPVSTNAANPLDMTVTTTATCTSTAGNASSVGLSITLSTGVSGSYATRQMQGSSSLHTLNYNLYADAARTQVMGDGTGGSVAVTNSTSISKHNSPILITTTIYGRVPAGQDPAVDSYSDTLVYTLNF